MTRTIQEIKELFKPLSDGVRVVLLIHRSKEGGFNNTHKRHLKKVITRNSEEFFKTIEEFQDFIKTDKRELRIYATFNNKNFSKGIRLFKQRQLDRDYDEEDVRNDFYLNSKNNFISCLMDKMSANESNFLFDLDDIDDRSFNVVWNTLKKHTKIIITYKTRNGFHIITKPFNYTLLQDNIQRTLHKDSLMLIDY